MWWSNQIVRMAGFLTAEHLAKLSDAQSIALIGSLDRIDALARVDLARRAAEQRKATAHVMSLDTNKDGVHIRYRCSCGAIGTWVETSNEAQGGVDRHLAAVEEISKS